RRVGSSGLQGKGFSRSVSTSGSQATPDRPLGSPVGAHAESGTSSAHTGCAHSSGLSPNASSPYSGSSTATVAVWPVVGSSSTTVATGSSWSAMPSSSYSASYSPSYSS